MDVCPTKEAIEDAFDRILKSTGFNIKQKLLECQIGGKKKGKGKRKRMMKGGVISKQNIITGIYLLISITITYFVNKGINEGSLPNVEEFKQILNGNCVTILQSYYPEQSNSLCSIIRSNLLIITAAIYKTNIPAILYIAGVIFFNKKSASVIMSAVDELADKIYNIQNLNIVTQEEGEGSRLSLQTPAFNLDNINRDLLLEPGRRVTPSIQRPAPAPSSFGAYRNPNSNLFPPPRSAPPLPIYEGEEKGGKRKRKRKTRRRGHKTMKGGSKHRMSKKRKHRKRTRRA